MSTNKIHITVDPGSQVIIDGKEVSDGGAVETTGIDTVASQTIQLLRFSGYEISDEDTTIQFIVNRTNDKIKNYCNIRDLPDELETLAVEMSMSAYIQMQVASNARMKIENGIGAVSSVRTGDEQTNFESSTGNITVVTKYIDSLLTEHKKELNNFRRMRW